MLGYLIITQEQPGLDRLASIFFDWGSRVNHGNVLSLVSKF